MSFLGKLLTRSDDSMQSAIDRFVSGEDVMVPVSSAYVSEHTALQLTAVYSCVRILAWTIASLPLPVYKRNENDDGKLRAPEHPLYRILHDSPNPYQTSFEWRSLTAVHQNLWGAGISEIEFDKKGYPKALWPIPPWLVTPKQTKSGSPFYEVRLPDGTTKNLESYRVVVFKTMTTSTYKWMSPIQLHRETIGSAMAVRDFGTKQFSQGTNPAGILTHPGKVTEKSEESLKDKMNQYKGLGGAHRVMLLDQGMKFDRVGLPPEDAQYLETRRFDIAEIARIYNIPLYMLQDHEKQTSWGSGIEEQKDGFVTFTLRPYLVQWEQEFSAKLFFSRRYFAEFVLEGLLRGKLSDRVKAYKELWSMGSISPNEIRQKENLNPVEGGDRYYVPLNYKATDEPDPVEPASPDSAGDQTEGGENG